MSRWLISIGFVSMALWVCSQNDADYKWIPSVKYSISDDAVWAIDGLENVYISEYGLINKYDSIGKLKFSQSIKSLGYMKQLVAVNTMKLVHFSEEQQTLCYFDNTLSPLDDCIDLIDQGIINAACISESNQPNKIWVFDNPNSRLLLLSLDNLYQVQEIVNLKGVLNINQIDLVKERGNRLFVLDRNSGVYVLDLYGTLLEKVELDEVATIDGNEQMLFILTEGKLMVQSLVTSDKWEFALPEKGISDFAYRNKFFFFKSKNTVHKFRLQFSE